MISYAVRANEKDNAIFSFKGLSTDTKPTVSYNGQRIANSSTFFAMDTQEVFFYNGASDEWLAQP